MYSYSPLTVFLVFFLNLMKIYIIYTSLHAGQDRTTCKLPPYNIAGPRIYKPIHTFAVSECSMKVGLMSKQYGRPACHLSGNMP